MPVSCFGGVTRPIESSKPAPTAHDARQSVAHTPISQAAGSIGLLNLNKEMLEKIYRHLPEHTGDKANFVECCKALRDALRSLVTAITIPATQETSTALIQALRYPNVTRLTLKDKVTLDELTHEDASIKPLNLSAMGTLINQVVFYLAEARPNLVSLNLSGCRKPIDAVIAHLALKCPNLSKLNLSWCTNLTDAGVIAFATNFPNLSSLDLSGMGKNLTDAGIITLANTCPKLSDLNLKACGSLTDTAVIALAESCPDLIRLDLSWCDRVTDAAVATLKERFPAIQVLK